MQVGHAMQFRGKLGQRVFGARQRLWAKGERSKGEKGRKEREREGRGWWREEESVTKGVVRGAGLEVVVIAKYYGLDRAERRISRLSKLWEGIREKERINVCKLNCPPTLFSARVLKSLLFAE